MPPLVLFALAGAGLYAGFRVIRSQIRLAAVRAEEAARAKAAAASGPKDLGPLVHDPQSGMYRPEGRL